MLWHKEKKQKCKPECIKKKLQVEGHTLVVEHGLNDVPPVEDQLQREKSNVQVGIKKRLKEELGLLKDKGRSEKPKVVLSLVNWTWTHTRLCHLYGASWLVDELFTNNCDTEMNVAVLSKSNSAFPLVKASSSESIQQSNQLSGPSLGLPTESNKCSSCGTAKFDECEAPNQMDKCDWTKRLYSSITNGSTSMLNVGIQSRAPGMLVDATTVKILDSIGHLLNMIKIHNSIFTRQQENSTLNRTKDSSVHKYRNVMTVLEQSGTSCEIRNYRTHAEKKGMHAQQTLECRTEYILLWALFLSNLWSPHPATHCQNIGGKLPIPKLVS
eukprot:Gb_38370 [translate_table: standard]